MVDKINKLDFTISTKINDLSSEIKVSQSKKDDALSELSEVSKDEDVVILEESQVEEKETEKSSLESLISGLADLIKSLVASLAFLFGGQKDNTESENDIDVSINIGVGSDVQESDKEYEMSASEKAYLTLNPDFVKEQIAKERVGYNEDNAWYKGYEVKREVRKITDEEVEAYLQLNQNVIKNAIASEKGTSVDDIATEEYEMSANEKAYLTLNPDFVKEQIAKERVGYNEDNSWYKGYEVKREVSKITDEEVQAYLQLNPDLIKNQIASERK